MNARKKFQKSRKIFWILTKLSERILVLVRTDFILLDALEKVCYVESIDSCISIETIAPSGDKNIKGSEVRYRSLLTGELLGSAQYWINESTELIDEGRALVAFAAEAERLEKEYACAD
jgi:hypothetical protein